MSPRNKIEGGHIHFQLSLDGTNKIKYEYKPSFEEEKNKCNQNYVKKIRKKIEYVVDKGKNIVHRQERLQGILMSPINIVFKAEDMWMDDKLSVEQIIRGLWQPFPLYNLNNRKMEKLIEDMKRGLGYRGKVVIPKELLGLAVLNYIDSYLKRKNTSYYIKTRYVKGLSTGRRSYGFKILKRLGYVEEHGNCWKRTDKFFNEKDFWPDS